MSRFLPAGERRRREREAVAEHTALRTAMGNFIREHGAAVQAIVVANKDTIERLHGSLVAGLHFNSAKDLRTGHRFDGVPVVVVGSVDAARARKNGWRVLEWPEQSR